jgi:prephenate dehydratase
MPLQNTIHGGVLETIDAMIAGPSDYGKKQLKPPQIIGELDLPIRHCLVVRTGTKMDDIRWVRSHEQVSARVACCHA